jgi:hypothetical protein
MEVAPFENRILEIKMCRRALSVKLRNSFRPGIC